MNAVMGRMLWKEFCALRMVWIACSMGVLFLNAVITVSAAAYNWQYYSGVFWALAMVVPAAYVVACTAMTFAGEREDRTSDWLVALAPPFASLYVSKQAFILLSGLAMQIFLAIAAACFTLADRTISQGFIPRDSVWETLRVSEFVFLECLVWGTFWSLQTGKAVNAIFKTIATLIVIFMVSGFTMDMARFQGNGQTGLWSGAFETFGWLRSAWTLGIVAASVVLGRKWLEGRGIEWETILAGWLRRRVAKPRAVTIERGEPWLRTWQRLWWLERQSLTAFGWMTLAATGFSLLSILVGDRPTIAWMVSFCCLVVLTGGLTSWRGEQARNQYHLLVNYGAAPLGLWANKLLMWLVVTVIAVAVVALPTVAFWEVLSEMYPKTSAATSFDRKWPSFFPLVDRFGHQPDLLLESTTAMTLYALMMFAAAFTWSLLCRKGVIAFGMTLMTLCALTPWYGVIAQLGMPMGVFLAPLPVWLLAISYRHLPAWWLDRSGWRVWLPRVIEFAVVPAVLILGAIAYRVYEIPWIELDRNIFPASRLSNPGELARIAGTPLPTSSHVADGVWRDLVRSVQNDTGVGHDIVQKNVTAWKAVADQVNRLPTRPQGPQGMASAMAEQPLPESEPKEDVPDPPELHAALQDLRSAVLKLPAMHPKAAVWEQAWSRGATMWGFAVEELCQESRKSLEAGRITESTDWLVAAARLSGAARRYVPVAAQIRIRLSDEQLFDGMVEWAQSPHQTFEELRRGLNRFSGNLPFWQNSYEDALANQEMLRRFPEENKVYWPWEEARRQRLFRISTINQATYLLQTEMQHSAASRMPEFHIGYRDWQRQAWEVRPSDRPERYLSPAQYRSSSVVGLNMQITDYLHEAETKYRATVTLMAVVGYRKMHARLPVSLAEVVSLFGESNTDAAEILRDPWSPGFFRYEPVGFPRAPATEPSLINEPSLWSVGPQHFELEVTQGHAFLVSTLPGQSMRRQLRNRQDTADWYHFPIPPQPK
jgi:hypothetical protein